MEKKILITLTTCLISYNTCVASITKLGDSNEQRDRYEVQGATATDTSTKMMWMRCSIGQSWSDKGCEDEATVFKTLAEAKRAVEKLNQKKYLGYDDWQLPHIEDLASLIHCNTGFRRKEEILSKTGAVKSIDVICKRENLVRPTINADVFPTEPRSWYWSSTQLSQTSSLTFGVVFYSGMIAAKRLQGDDKHDNGKRYVRAIRPMK